MDEKELLYGAEGASQATQAGQQVKFAITKGEKEGTLGTEGSGYVEFAEKSQTIYVNGVQYGATDGEGNNIVATYATKEEATYIGGTGITVTPGTDNSEITLDAANGTTLGGVKGGDDVTIADGVMTVQHAVAADKVDVAATGESDTALNVVLVSGAADSAELKTTNVLQYTVDAEGAAHLSTSATATQDAHLVTKKYVDDKIDDVVGAAADGMHYRGSVASADSLPAADGKWGEGDDAIEVETGDFVIASGAFVLGSGDNAETVEAGDYLVFDGTNWNVINRNLTTTTEIKTDDSALIATEGAVKAYVDALDEKVDDLAYIVSVTGDSGSYTATDNNGSVKIAGGNVLTSAVADGVVTINHDALSATATATAGAATTFQKAETGKTLSVDVVTAVTVDNYGHTTGWTTSNLDLTTLVGEIGTDITTGDAAAAKTVAQTAISDENSYHLLAGKNAADGNTEAVYASDATLDKDGNLAVKGLTVDGVEVAGLNDVAAGEAATTTVDLTEGVLTVSGVSAIAVDGEAKTTNTYNAAVLQQSIFWTVVE